MPLKPKELTAAFNGLFYVAGHTTTAINIGIIQGSIPVFVLIGAVVVLRSRARPLQVAGIGVTLLGVGIVTSAGDLDRLLALEFNRGDLFMIIACVLYSGPRRGCDSVPEPRRHPSKRYDQQ